MGDRTHRVALRGTVKAEYVFQAGVPGKVDIKPVPMRHFVNAHVNILNGVVNGVQGTKGVVTIAGADDDFVRANEQFAQVGLLLIPNYAPNVPWPGKVNLVDGLDRSLSNYDAADNRILDPEESELLTPNLRTQVVTYLRCTAGNANHSANDHT